ncbi:MAG: hypothetical protein JO339_32375 [Alphaproteobacteria bacterium]|nr:hypothetical protein [Alphaproteobacteria bacterium]
MMFNGLWRETGIITRRSRLPAKARSEHSGRVPMALQVTSGTTFTQLYKQFKPGLFKSDSAHVRGGQSLQGSQQVYTHNPLMPNGRGEEALARRLQKYEAGAGLVKQAMANEYGTAVADAVFRRVKEARPNLDKEVTRGDLNRLRNEIQQYQKLAPEEKLRYALRQETPGEIRKEWGDVWRSGFDRTNQRFFADWQYSTKMER